MELEPEINESRYSPRELKVEENVEYIKEGENIIIRHIIDTYYHSDEEQSAKKYYEKAKDQISRNEWHTTEYFI